MEILWSDKHRQVSLMLLHVHTNSSYLSNWNMMSDLLPYWWLLIAVVTSLCSLKSCREWFIWPVFHPNGTVFLTFQAIGLGEIWEAQAYWCRHLFSWSAHTELIFSEEGQSSDLYVYRPSDADVLWLM